MSKERIGFIGLGLMGTGMATNLVRKGWPLTVMAHRKREGVEALLKLGAHEAKTPKAVAEASDVVVLCVTGSPQVEALVNGPEGLVAAGKPLMIIDCSTSNPAVTTRLAEELKAKTITLVDAPMSRTPKDAMEGNLDIMAGGTEAEFARARQVLDAFAGRVTHTGPVGSGHTMKLLNNFVSLGYAAIYSEALMLGVKAGLTPKTFDSVIRGGRMDCGFYQTFFKYVIERDRNAHQFTLSNANKDLGYLASAVLSLGAANPIGAAVRNSFATAVGTGQGEKYVPMLSDIVAELNGVTIADAKG
jgi:3-hydroxyisobutyrate dehydrogenase-like beta-hydroxyacid dehydrogenase